MLRRVLFVLVFVSTAFQLNAQPTPSDAIFTKYASEDGLSQMVVRAIIQDRDGFIWVGTEDGLNKFDGYDFKVYRNIRNDSSSLPDNFIYCLSPAADGGVWVGTNSGGLAKYNVTSNSFTSYQHDPSDESSLSNNRVESVFEDSKGVVWVGTDGGGLCKLDTETGKMVRYMYDDENPNSISSNSIIGIVEDKDGKIWVRTRLDIELYNRDTEGFTKLNIPEIYWNSASDMSGSFYIDSDGFIWATLSNVLVKVNSATKEFEIVEFSNYNKEYLALIDIYPYDDKHLWISDYNGVFLFNKDDRSVSFFHHSEIEPNSIAAGGCLAILQDRTGSLWVGVNSKGISKLNINSKEFTHFKHDANRPETIGGSVIKALLMDNQKNIWVAADSRLEKLYYNEFGQNKYVRDTSSRFSSLFSTLPNCFLEDVNGNVWIGSWGNGIKILPNGETDGVTELLSDGTSATLLNDIVQAFHEDRSGNIWIGTEVGLCLYNPSTGSFRSFVHSENNENTIAPYGVQANCIVEDSYGGIWVGTWGGLTRMIPMDKEKNSFDTDYKFVRYLNNPEDANTISDNRVISLCYDKAYSTNEIYAGTYGKGLNRIAFDGLDIKKNEVKIYTRAEGMPNDVVYGILYDNRGVVWLSTNEGIAAFTPKTEEFAVYDVNDGLQANQFYWGARTKGASGELLFGGINGFNMFLPEEIVSDQTTPDVVFTDLKVLNQSVPVGEKVNKHVILKKGINVSEKIKLYHRDNVFSIEFAGLHYAFSKDNTYRYMLEGFDEDWIEVDSRKRFASYTNLDAGTYTFKVDAANYDGVWTNEPRELIVRIVPPFWKRWLFRIAALLVLAYGAYKVYQNRMDRIKKDKLVLEQKIKEGDAILKEKVKEVELQKEEIQKRDIEEQELRFTNRGIVKFSDIISTAGENLKELSQVVISELVNYVGGVMGVMYVKQEQGSDKYLELYGKYAIDEIRTQVRVGEGYVGTCFLDGQTMVVNNIPAGYSTLKSGLGEVEPKLLCLVPIKQDDVVIGVIEIAALEEIPQYKISFIEKIVGNIGSVITIKQAGEQMNMLLKQSQEQTEGLRSQEEEMRQNMEEMHATQEELQRQIEEQEDLETQLNSITKLLEALMSNLSAFAYFKDTRGQFAKASKGVLTYSKFDTMAQLIGKTEYDIYDKALADELAKEDAQIIAGATQHVNKAISIKDAIGVVHELTITKLPIADTYGKVLGVLVMSKDAVESIGADVEVEVRES